MTSPALANAKPTNTANTQANATHAEGSIARTPPHNLDIEKALLAALMSIDESWDRVSDIVKEAEFYANRHRLIFSAIKHLNNANMPYDVVMVSQWLDQQHKLEDAGGEKYLQQILSDSPATLFNMVAYAKKVREFAILRQLITAGNDMLSLVYDPKENNVNDILDRVESSIFSIAEQHKHESSGSGPKEISDVLTSVVAKQNELLANDGSIIGLSTGFTELDNKTLGLQRGDMIVVAARPSMGKTAFAINLAEAVLFKDQPVVVFSMEMPAEAIAMRLLSSLGQINQTSLRSGQMNQEDWSRFTSAVQFLNEKPLYIDDGTALPPTEVRARCRRIAKKHDGKLGLVVVDYLQLMRVPSMEGNRVGEVGEISRSLKSLARELDCPVVVLSQLNRGVESRPNKRPMMSDIRESGAIEQDADLIMFLYRDEYYNEDSKFKGIGEVIIGKQRNGPIGTVRLWFEGQFTRFRDIDPAQLQGLEELDEHD